MSTRSLVSRRRCTEKAGLTVLFEGTQRRSRRPTRRCSGRGFAPPLNGYIVGQRGVQQLLQEWLSKIRREQLVLSEVPGAGANENLWCVAIPSTANVDVDELVTFLRSASAVRRDIVHEQNAHPVSFYAWHDDMAGQLRFSTARCTTSALPFGCPIELVDDPEPVVREFLQSGLRDGIPWRELKADLRDAAGGPDDSGHSPALKVWAIQLNL